MPQTATEPRERRLGYLRLLSDRFPTCQAAYTEAINLKAILNLPKATEHYMSDIHGEYEAFAHILNNCSGVVRELVDKIFADELCDTERADLCTLIYYPRAKLARIHREGLASDTWYYDNLFRIVRVARWLSGLYTRSKVRKAMPVAYAYIIDELLRASGVGEKSRHDYHVRIIDSIIETGSADDFIESLASLVKRLAVDRLHIVGDIFDRGQHADKILDELMSYHTLDFQWGNHDICWMGASAGSEACVASVVRNNVRYGAYGILESAYGISLRELALFAERTYTPDDVISPTDKAINVILFKLEGQLIRRQPEFQMEDRLLLDKIDLSRGTVEIAGKTHELRTRDLPTIDPEDPYRLSDDEQHVIDGLVRAFRDSERLSRQIEFLYEHGSMYLVSNGNLLFHGCIPLYMYGSFRPVSCAGRHYAGRAYMDFCDRMARRAWHGHDRDALDWMWYLWCGRLSPLSGRVMKTFERTYLSDKSTWEEPRDPYYEHVEDPAACRMILEEFGCSPDGVIINGHTPVHAAAGENPVKAGGMLVVIDGGFCQAYHQTTGIAGYTLIADPTGMRIKAHRPFASIKDVLDLNADIMSDDDRFRRWPRPLTVGDTDAGVQIREQIADLRELLSAYRNGDVPERTASS